MKKIILATVLACASLSAYAENALNYNILEFQERANVSVPNDIMNITLFIQEQNPNRNTASQNVTRKLNALQNKLKQYKQLNVELGSRQVYPQYNKNNQITHWQDSVELRVKSSDFETMSKIIAESQSEAMLRDMYFSVSPEKRTQAIEKASEEALNTVRQRAEFLSKKMGFSGYNLVKVELTDSFEQNHRKMSYGNRAYALATAPAPESMQINADQAGEEEISQNVRVSIQMK